MSDDTPPQIAAFGREPLAEPDGTGIGRDAAGSYAGGTKPKTVDPGSASGSSSAAKGSNVGCTCDWDDIGNVVAPANPLCPIHGIEGWRDSETTPPTAAFSDCRARELEAPETTRERD